MVMSNRGASLDHHGCLRSRYVTSSSRMSQSRGDKFRFHGEIDWKRVFPDVYTPKTCWRKYAQVKLQRCLDTHASASATDADIHASASAADADIVISLLHSPSGCHIEKRGGIISVDYRPLRVPSSWAQFKQEALDNVVKSTFDVPGKLHLVARSLDRLSSALVWFRFCIMQMFLFGLDAGNRCCPPIPWSVGHSWRACFSTRVLARCRCPQSHVRFS